MSDSIVKVPKLPRSGFADGEQIADPNGNIWEYNEETKEWFLRGKFEPLPIVTEDQNGLVSPEIYRKLSLIQELIDKGVSFDVFKLKSSLENPYFFYFQSSDGLIKFIPEAESTLRVEIDRAKLYAMLIKKCCIGPKGKTGPQGFVGPAGKPAANEVFRVPRLENETTFVISTTVASPLDPNESPISLRLFNEEKTLVADFLVFGNGTSEIALIDGITINEDTFNISYNPITKLLVANITLLTFTGDLSLWRYKARQSGPKGASGVDGKNYLEVVNTILEDNSLEADTAIVSLRKSGTSDLKYLTSEINADICVSRISASENSPLKTKDYINQKYLAAEITTRDCKNIGVFNLAKAFDLEEIKVPELELPSWVPPSGCGQKTRFNNFKYNWWDYLEEDIRYMFKIVPTVKPPEKCCEQEFWYCPSAGDICNIKGSNGEIPVLQMPKRKPEDECVCDCENPIDFELQAGGYSFPLLDATSQEFKNNSVLSSSTKSVLDGSTDRFTSKFLVAGPTKIVVNIEFSPDICGGSNTEKKNCGFREISEISTIASIKDLSGGATFTSSDVLASSSFPTTLEFTLTTPEYNGPKGKLAVESSIELIIDVNTTKMNICRGYIITVAAMRIETTFKQKDPKPKQVKLPQTLQAQLRLRNATSPEELREIEKEFASYLPPIDRAEGTSAPASPYNPPTTPEVPRTDPTLPTGNQVFRLELDQQVVCPQGYKGTPSLGTNPIDRQSMVCFPTTPRYETINGVTRLVTGSIPGVLKLTGRLFFNTIGLQGKRMYSPSEITSKNKIDKLELVSASHASEIRDPIIKRTNIGNETQADIWYDDVNIWFSPDWQGEIIIYAGGSRQLIVNTENPQTTFDSQGMPI